MSLYKVNTNGDVFSIRGNVTTLLKGWVTKSGYRMYNIKNKDTGKRSNVFGHRLVALALIPNPDKKPYVNHKDGDKLNNKVSNLEWVTASENMSHAIQNGLNTHPTLGLFGINHPKSKGVVQLDLNGNFLKLFGSQNEAERATGIKSRAINNCLKGRSETSGGYRWESVKCVSE